MFLYMAYLEKDSLVRFTGPSRASRSWPRRGELGVVTGGDGEAIFVAWEYTQGSVAWPEAWLTRVAEILPEP
jgi:hypothetical protein